MGMGEPLLNYERVMQAARILSEPCGVAIAAKAITISTVGVVPMIRRFTAERRPYRLVVSLTSADPQRAAGNCSRLRPNIRCQSSLKHCGNITRSCVAASR